MGIRLTSRSELFTAQRWLPLVLPLAVFMLVGWFEPKPPDLAAHGAPSAQSPAWALPYAAYPWVYLAKLLLTGAAMLYVLPVYREFRLRVGWLALVVGLLGAALWIGLCELPREWNWLDRIGLGWLSQTGARSAYNPLEQLRASPPLAWGFLALRFLGLVLIVPIIEEFFLRGFVMRFFVQPEWWNVSIGRVNAAAVVVGTVVPMLMHPGELLAAAAWFSLITWLMVRTRSLWACVAAHAVTNLMLGLYVLWSGHWYLM